MIKAALAAAALAVASPAFAGAPAAAAVAGAQEPEPTGMIDLSLVEALSAVHHPQLAGIFSFVAEKNSPFAFADYVARDKKAMRLYLDKLGDDVKAAQGLTEWDHEVCASLINLYASPVAATFGAPDAKRMKQINDCMLAPTLTLEAIVAKRKK